ncbi:MAG: c-type cytochrome [Gemmatimonadales bacterium]
MAVLAAGGAESPSVGQPDQRDSLSAFARKKAEYLIRERMSCLGCHRLDGDGGRIGADLSDVGGRRTREFIAAVLHDPKTAVPGTIMTYTPMPEKTLQLIVAYLSERGSGNGSPSSQSRVAVEAKASGSDSDAADPVSTYQQYCAPCHGVTGEGDGPNAQYLPVRPVVHADSAYMSTRSDDVLYDAVFAGGRIMNRSNRMPGFGHTLAPQTIWGLVRYMRELCQCVGPMWSRDGSD